MHDRWNSGLWLVAEPVQPVVLKTPSIYHKLHSRCWELGREISWAIVALYADGGNCTFHKEHSFFPGG
jgi:hypothetical protein